MRHPRPIPCRSSPPSLPRASPCSPILSKRRRAQFRQIHRPSWCYRCHLIAAGCGVSICGSPSQRRPPDRSQSSSMSSSIATRPEMPCASTSPNCRSAPMKPRSVPWPWSIRSMRAERLRSVRSRIERLSPSISPPVSAPPPRRQSRSSSSSQGAGPDHRRLRDRTSAPADPVCPPETPGANGPARLLGLRRGPAATQLPSHRTALRLAQEPVDASHLPTATVPGRRSWR